jgi:putative serine protease PepD
MGYAGDEHDEERLGEFPDGGEDDDLADVGADGHPRRAVPDPLDRLWMHPSELAPFMGPSTTSAARHRPMWTTTLVAGAAGAILTLGVLGAVGAIGGSSDTTDHAVVPTSTPIISAPVRSAGIVSAATVATGVGPSVVAVSVRDKSGTRRGSGVCVRRSHGVVTTANEIITSDRLIGSASTVDVTTSKGVVHSASIVGRDATSDLVLLRLDNGIPAAESARHEAKPGDTVWVVGASRSGGASPWMSDGVLSSTDSLVSLSTGPTTSGLLETSAASSSAASGGALVDAEGDVTGIVLAPVGDSRMTYAVPIETALAIADDLRTQGWARHGALGINGVDEADGPTITGMVAGGPADRAGIRIGDVVQSVDKREVDSMGDVIALVRHDAPGEPIVVEVRRGTSHLIMNATLATMGTL